mgnify:CR=1 FL=1
MKHLITGLILAFLLAGCNINSSVGVTDGSTHDGDLSTINGSVRVGVGSRLNGNAETVNGSVRIGDQATLEDAETVNGSISIGNDVVLQNADAINGSISTGTGVSASGSLDTVNGKIEVGAGSVIEKGLYSVNGSIIVNGAEVGRISTVTGNITLQPNSRVNGEVLVEQNRGFGGDRDGTVEVTIGANSTVVGPLRFERDVILRIHESATVGEIIGAEPTYFND